MGNVHVTREFSSETVRFSIAMILNPTVMMTVKCSYK